MSVNFFSFTAYYSIIFGLYYRFVFIHNSNIDLIVNISMVTLTSIYEALMLLNFCGDWGRGLGARTKLFRISNCRKLLGSKVLGICLKLSLAKKNFPQNHPRFKKIKKMTKGSFRNNCNLQL